MDRYPLYSKTIALTALLSLAACASGESKEANHIQEDFPASQSRDIEDSSHTALTAPTPAQPSMREPLPGIAEEVAKTAAPVEMEPEKFSEYMRRARSRFSSDDFSGAQSDYEEAVSKRPESFRPRVQLARTFLAMGRTEGARDQVEVAIEIDGASSLAWNTLGRVELAERDYDAAVVSFERAALENEDNSYAWNNLGYVHIEAGDYEAAAEALEAATSGASPTGYMWNNLGMAYEHLDRITLARASYRQAADLGSGRAQDNFDRLEGVVSLALDSEEEALDESEEEALD